MSGRRATGRLAEEGSGRLDDGSQRIEVAERDGPVHYSEVCVDRAMDRKSITVMRRLSSDAYSVSAGDVRQRTVYVGEWRGGEQSVSGERTEQCPPARANALQYDRTRVPFCFREFLFLFFFSPFCALTVRTGAPWIAHQLYTLDCFFDFCF